MNVKIHFKIKKLLCKTRGLITFSLEYEKEDYFLWGNFPKNKICFLSLKFGLISNFDIVLIEKACVDFKNV